MSEAPGLGSPLVSVIVPTFDRPEMLTEAIGSVSAQTYPTLELVIVDDASPQPVEPIVSDRLSGELTWTCIRHDRNRGANAARVTGIEAASGEFITFLDDDDRWSPSKVSRQIEVFRHRGPSTGVVIVGQRLVDEDGRTTLIKRPRVSGEATADLLTGTRAGPFSTLAVRRSVVSQAGLPDVRFPSLQDREWLVRLSRTCQFASIPDVLVRRRMGGHGQIADQFEARRDETYPRFLETHGDLASSLGLERAFRAWLAGGVASSALRAGEYRDAVRFGLRAIRANPAHWEAWGCVLIASGGDFTYRPAIGLKRKLAQVAD